MNPFQARTHEPKGSSEFDTKGVEFILRGAEEQWNLELSCIRYELSVNTIGPTSSPDTRAKKIVCDLFEWRPVPPNPASEKELPPSQHVQLLKSGVLLDNLVEFYSGEAHIYRAALCTRPFFSFIRLVSVWCLYLCKLGFRHEVVAVVCCLHTMGMAHRAGEMQQLGKERKHIEDVVTRIRKEAYGMLGGQGQSIKLF